MNGLYIGIDQYQSSLILGLVLGCGRKLSVGRIQTRTTDLIPLQVCGSWWHGFRLGVFTYHGDRGWTRGDGEDMGEGGWRINEGGMLGDRGWRSKGGLRRGLEYNKIRNYNGGTC